MRESRPLASRERQPCREMESPFRWVESRATRLHQSTMSLRPGTLAAGFVWPCLPTKTHEPPSGGLWIHEIKHDGFRIIARKNGERVRLYSRPGNDLTRRFPLIVETLARLRSRSCIIDGDAVACDDNGVADLIRNHRANDRVLLYAFDLIELNDDDLRRDPLEVRKATLASIVAKAGPGIRFNEHIEGDGPTVFAHACKMGLEGIVSKQRDSAYRSGPRRACYRQTWKRSETTVVGSFDHSYP